jgi:hypothetical protein
LKGLSALCLLFVIDGIIGLAQGNNMYTLKPGGTNGVIANVVTIVVCLVLGPALWGAARRRDFAEAMRQYDDEAPTRPSASGIERTGRRACSRNGSGGRRRRGDCTRQSLQSGRGAG